MAVNFVCLHALGADGLAQTTMTPASAVMRLALGERGATLIAVGIAISTLRVPEPGNADRAARLFCHGEDGLFFKGVALARSAHARAGGGDRVTRRPRGRHRAVRPVRANLGLRHLGRFRLVRIDRDHALHFRQRHKIDHQTSGGFRVPGHPWTTIFFVTACTLVVAATVYNYPKNSVIGWAILAAGVPVYFFWRWWRRDD